MQEEWRDVAGYEQGYRISNLGRIYSKKLKRVLTPPVDKDGYYRVGLWKNQEVSKQRLHRIVALHFIPNPEDKPVVNHINGDKKDNRVQNLEWNTVLENEQHSRRVLGKVIPPHGHKSLTLVKDSEELVFTSTREAMAFLRCSGQSFRRLKDGLKNTINGYALKNVSRS